MPTNLTGSDIKDTYDQLLHVSDGPASAEKVVHGGTGVATALSIGTGSVSVDNIKLDGNVISTTDTNGNLTLTPNGTGEVQLTGKFGYSTGGGTVTQTTNKTTAVTLNAKSGQITMNNASMSNNTTAGFTLTNSFVAATDVVIVNIASGATADGYILTVDAVAAGSCRISVRHNSGGALSEALVLNFVVIKGVTS
ncbi:hypothetical protein OAC87_04015 [Pseudomonadales bacterium]|jgi:hypothetical protein|nr:hypothetical protein [Pseudomonadales bacterium]